MFNYVTCRNKWLYIHQSKIEYLQPQGNKGNFTLNKFDLDGFYMSQNVAVILSGCGVFDGAEINEVVLTLLHLEKNGASYQCFARINLNTMLSITLQERVSETRNVLVESARIVRVISRHCQNVLLTDLMR